MDTSQINDVLSSYCDNCRICLEINRQMTLIQSLKELKDFNVLLTFLNVEVTADTRYPNKICAVCLNQLRNIVLFKQKCESSFNYLKNILNDNGFQILPIQTGNHFDNDKWIKTEDPGDNDFDQDINIDQRCQQTADESCQELKNEIYCEIVNNHVETDESNTASFSCNNCKSTNRTCSCINNNIIKYEIESKENSFPKSTSKNDFKCQFCEKIFKSTYHQQRHEASHLKRLFKCDRCLKSFKTEDLLTRHVRIHLGLKPFPCTECSRSYSTKDALTGHKKIYHSDTPPQKETCQKCGASVLYLAAHNNFKHSGIKLECQYCAKKFTFKTGLRDHVKTFHENSGEAFRLLCTLCGKKFRRGSDLNRHSKSKHSDERNYPCRYCDKKFKTSTERWAHEKSHSNDRRFKCTYCSKAFTDKKTLDSHVLIHTGEKPFSCSICSKTFRQGATLRNHTKLVHGRALIKKK